MEEEMNKSEVIERLQKVSTYFKSMLKVGWQGDADIYREHRTSVKMAINLLKEQETVKPILKREGRNKYYNDYVCPRCDNEVVYEQNYCSECGVKFMWEGR